MLPNVCSVVAVCVWISTFASSCALIVRLPLVISSLASPFRVVRMTMGERLFKKIKSSGTSRFHLLSIWPHPQVPESKKYSAPSRKLKQMRPRLSLSTSLKRGVNERGTITSCAALAPILMVAGFDKVFTDKRIHRATDCAITRRERIS